VVKLSLSLSYTHMEPGILRKYFPHFFGFHLLETFLPMQLDFVKRQNKCIRSVGRSKLDLGTHRFSCSSDKLGR
jgi:hypothetical protein